MVAVDTIDEELARRVVRLAAYDRGGGVVELQFEQAGRVIGGCALAYSQQGQMVRNEGDPSDIELLAGELNVLLDGFNAALDRSCA